MTAGDSHDDTTLKGPLGIAARYLGRHGRRLQDAARLPCHDHAAQVRARALSAGARWRVAAAYQTQGRELLGQGDRLAITAMPLEL